MALLYDPTRGMRPLPPEGETVAHDSWERRRLEGLAETHDPVMQERRWQSDMALARGLVIASFVSPLTSVFTTPAARAIASQYEGGAEEFDQQMRDALTTGVVFGGMRGPQRVQVPPGPHTAMSKIIEAQNSLAKSGRIEVGNIQTKGFASGVKTPTARVLEGVSDPRIPVAAQVSPLETEALTRLGDVSSRAMSTYRELLNTRWSAMKEPFTGPRFFGGLDRRFRPIDKRFRPTDYARLNWKDAVESMPIQAERATRRLGSAAQRMMEVPVPVLSGIPGSGKALWKFFKRHKAASIGVAIATGVATGTILHQYNEAARTQLKEAEEAVKRNARISTNMIALTKLQQSLNEDPNSAFSSSEVFSDIMVRAAQAIGETYALGGLNASQAMEAYSGWYKAVQKANPEAFRVRERELRSGGILVDPETFIRDYGIGESTKKEGQ